MKPMGLVSIVGAGPGDPELITVKGIARLRDADVILHDRLVDLRLLDEARSDADVINVGKESGDEDLQQEHIHWLMIENARQGKRVCRLKGGDPFVFGRGGEEGQALREAGVPFEIIPGISSSIAVPAAAGIPVTHRDHAHSFMVITGSRSHDLDSEEWVCARNLVKAGGTLIVLMGFGRLSAIAKALLSSDCAAATPVAVISSGTRPDQDARVGTLSDIARRVDGVGQPAIIVIGEVVSLSAALSAHLTHQELSFSEFM